MPRRGMRRNNKSRRGPRSRTLRIPFNFQITNATTSLHSVGQLKEAGYDQRCAFRPVCLVTEASSDGKAIVLGLRGYGPTDINNPVAVGQEYMVGENVRRRTLRWPRSLPWFAPKTSDTWPIWSVEANCTNKARANQTCAFVGYLIIQVGPVMTDPSCSSVTVIAHDPCRFSDLPRRELSSASSSDSLNSLISSFSQLSLARRS